MMGFYWMFFGFCIGINYVLIFDIWIKEGVILVFD